MICLSLEGPLCRLNKYSIIFLCLSVSSQCCGMVEMIFFPMFSCHICASTLSNLSLDIAKVSCFEGSLVLDDQHNSVLSIRSLSTGKLHRTRLLTLRHCRLVVVLLHANINNPYSACMERTREEIFRSRSRKDAIPFVANGVNFDKQQCGK